MPPAVRPPRKIPPCSAPEANPDVASSMANPVWSSGSAVAAVTRRLSSATGAIRSLAGRRWDPPHRRPGRGLGRRRGGAWWARPPASWRARRAPPPPRPRRRTVSRPLRGQRGRAGARPAQSISESTSEEANRQISVMRPPNSDRAASASASARRAKSATDSSSARLVPAMPLAAKRRGRDRLRRTPRRASAATSSAGSRTPA